MRVSRKGIPRNVKLTTTVLKPSTRGKNKRGTCLHKRTKLTSPEKRQYVPGFQPQPVTAYRPSGWK